MANYEPYLPLNVAKYAGKDIWTFDGGVVQYRIGPFTVPCPTRMTVLRGPSGKLLLHSPIRLIPELIAEVKRLGNIATIVAPNSFHFLYLQAWANACPEATVLVSPRAPKSRVLPERAISLDSATIPSLDEFADYIVVDAGGWAEVAFLHHTSRSLVLTDLIQNFESERVDAPLTRALLRIGGSTGSPPSASIEMRLSAALHRRRSAIRESFSAIREWRPEQILIAHGARLTGPPDETLSKGFAWAS